MNNSFTISVLTSIVGGIITFFIVQELKRQREGI